MIPAIIDEILNIRTKRRHRCLHEDAHLRCRRYSIAVPILVQATRQFVGQPQHLREVRFVVLEDALFQRFAEEIRVTS